MKLHTYIPSNRITPSHQIIGQIYWKLDDNTSFPHIEWTDFTLIIIYWWLARCRELLNGSVRESEFLFMDGPYSILLSNKKKNILNVCFIHGEKTVGTSVITLRNLADQLIEHAIELIKYCDQHNFISPEYYFLRGHILSLQSSLTHK